MKSSTRNWCVGVMIGVCLFGAWAYVEKKAMDGVAPASWGTNLMAFLELQPEPKSVRQFLHGKRTYIEVLGNIPKPSLLTLPSGPPAYVFNEFGVLVDWTADRGEDPRFVKKWGGFANGTFITTEQAKELVRARSSTK